VPFQCEYSISSMEYQVRPLLMAICHFCKCTPCHETQTNQREQSQQCCTPLQIRMPLGWPNLQKPLQVNSTLTARALPQKHKKSPQLFYGMRLGPGGIHILVWLHVSIAGRLQARAKFSCGSVRVCERGSNSAFFLALKTHEPHGVTTERNTIYARWRRVCEGNVRMLSGGNNSGHRLMLWG
jgi:hypothetical protein